MPIRTHRGRAAVYRRLWSTPMRSPKHLIATLVVVAGLLTVIGFLLPSVLPTSGTTGPGAADEPQTAADSSSAPPATDRPSRLPSEPLQPSDVDPSPHAVSAAEEWAQEWVDHEDTDKAAWLKRLEPLTTEEYLGQLETIELDNIPASRVTGDGQPREAHPRSVEVDVPTDGPTLRITVIKAGDTWRVTRYGQGD